MSEAQRLIKDADEIETLKDTMHSDAPLLDKEKASARLHELANKYPEYPGLILTRVTPPAGAGREGQP